MNEYLIKIRQLKIVISRNPLYLKYGVFLIPFVTLLVALIILLLITIPQSFKLIENNQVLAEIKQKKVDYQTKISTLNKVDTEEYKANLNDVLYLLPTDKDIPSAINSILDVLSSSGLTLTNFSLGTATPAKNGAESFAVNIDISGNITQLKNFIELTSKSSRLMKITDLSINNSTGQEIQSSIDLIVFYAPLDTSVKTSAEQKISLLTEDDQKLLADIKQYISNVASVSDQTIINTPTGKNDPFN
jgi:Tfp pilus assembly protein PilO